MKTEIKIIEDIKQFQELEEHWNELLAKTPIKSVFLTWTWLYSWWAVYGGEKRLWIITAWKEKTLVGLAPLMLEKRKKGGTGLNFLVNLGTPQSDAGGFLYHPDHHEVVDDLIKTLISKHSMWDVLELNVLYTTGLECEAIFRLHTPKEFYLKEEQNEHFFVPLEKDWDTFSNRLSKKFMHNLRRAVRLADELGMVELRHYSGELVNDQLVHELIDINRHSHYPRLYNSKKEQDLLFELIRNGGKQHNWLDIYILNIDNKPIAYEYGFVYEGRFESWRSGFNTNLPQNISIGKLLALRVVQTCIEEGYREIDFLRGDEAYKLEWKPEKKIYSNIRIFNRKKAKAVLSYRWLENIKPIIKKINHQFRTKQ